MKKILLLSSFAALGLTATQAQILEFAHNPATLTTTGNGSSAFVTVYNTVTNLNSSDITYKWQLINASEIPTGWAYNGFCDNSTCYNAGTIIAWETGTAVDCYVEGGKRNTDFKLQLEIADELPAAVGTFKFRAEVIEGGTQVDTITFIVTKSASTGIEVIPVDDTRINIFPNPATEGQVNIFIANELNAQKINVYNMLGQIVATQQVSKNSEINNINVNALSRGLHFIQIIDDNNMAISTRKLQIN